MKEKLRISLVIFIVVLISLLVDPIFSIIIKTNNNLDNMSIHYESDYQNLKKAYDDLLEFHSHFEDNIISKVVVHDPLLFFDEVIILKGSDEGITKGSIVINERGLVGIIKGVNNHSSVVQLLGNKDTKIAVKIGEVSGLLESENGTLMIKNITSSKEVSINDVITTSNYGVVAPDITVGKVREIKRTNNNLSYEIVVEPAVDFHNLNYVVIKENEND